MGTASCELGIIHSPLRRCGTTRIQNTKKTALRRQGESCTLMKEAERTGFEPANRFCRLHAFQACLFNHSSTSPSQKPLQNYRKYSMQTNVANNNYEKLILPCSLVDTPPPSSGNGTTAGTPPPDNPAYALTHPQESAKNVNYG